MLHVVVRVVHGPGRTVLLYGFVDIVLGSLGDEDGGWLLACHDNVAERED